MISFNKCFINLCISINNTKKAGLHYCCSAIRGSGIAFCSKQQHCSPRCMHIYARICVPYYTYHRAPCAALFWNSEFTRFRIAKTKRVRRLFQYVRYLTHPKDIFPQRGLNTAKLSVLRCKITAFFQICKGLG